MKMKLFLIAVLLTLCCPAFSAGEQKIPEGMASYFMVLLKSGPNRNQLPEEAAEIQAGHLEHFRKAVQAGKLVCVGPLIEAGELQGISIYQTETLQETQDLANSDPAVKAGRLIAEIHPWLGPKGLGEGYIERAQQKPLDQLEFETFQLGFLRRGDRWTPERTPEIEKIQEGHMANINRLADEGKLIAAGPFTDGGDLRGVFVFTTKTIEEAKALSETDPAVQAGRLRIELYSWMINKGVIPPVKR